MEKKKTREWYTKQKKDGIRNFEGWNKKKKKRKETVGWINEGKKKVQKNEQ